MGAHEFGGNGQAEACSTGAGGTLERLEQMLAGFRRHTRTRVRDLEDGDDAFAFSDDPDLTPAQQDGLSRALYCLKDRAKTLPELLEKAHFTLTSRPLQPDEKSRAALDSVSRSILLDLTPHLRNTVWERDALEASVAAVAAAQGVGLGKLAQPLRAALAGRTISPSVFDMMLVLGRDETIARLRDVAEAKDIGAL